MEGPNSLERRGQTLDSRVRKCEGGGVQVFSQLRSEGEVENGRWVVNVYYLDDHVVSERTLLPDPRSTFWRGRVGREPLCPSPPGTCAYTRAYIKSFTKSIIICCWCGFYFATAARIMKYECGDLFSWFCYNCFQIHFEKRTVVSMLKISCVEGKRELSGLICTAHFRLTCNSLQYCTCSLLCKSNFSVDMTMNESKK